jgi:P-type Mg2+ transporter
VTTAARPPLALPAHDQALRPPDASKSEFWSISIDQLLGEIGSSPTGLTGDEARRRLATHGPNVAVRRVSKGWLRGLADQFRSPITLLLFIAAAISIGVGERVDGTVILLILLVSGLLGFWQEHHAATAVNELLSLVRTTTSVTRDGQLTIVPIEEIVPGDVVSLSAGATIPGDARLLESNDLFVDQAALTGESYPAEKTPGTVAPDAPLADRTNAIHLGTHVVSGTTTALIVRTGPDTEFGEIAQRLELRPPKTEFELGVRHFGYLLLEITFVLAIITFTANMALQRPVLDSLLFTLALAVGLTPQLLPAIVSVTLAQGARHMAAERVIVRRLASIEDLGGMQILCTDKTGTITEGVVSIRAVEDWNGAASARAHLFACINAQLETGFGNPIDDALRAHPVAGVERYAKVDEVPYDFIRKRLSVAVREEEQGRLLITKGAVTSTLEICDSAENVGGQIFPIADVRAAINARVEAFSRDACRCLAVAYRRLDTEGPVGREDEHGLTFLGLMALSDPLKPHVRETLGDLSRLGIRLTLITGDNRHVATEIAREAGLDAFAIRTGAELRQLTEDALISAAPGISVFAEVEPNQKERIIRALKKSGYSVGYLGDGINDAAALHAADVGISVESATDVTKQAADIVLLDKDLAVLGRGVREGRRAFANMLKYIFITTSANFGNMFSMAGATFFASFLPLLPKQILLINVLSDLPAMAIATDRLDPELVVKPRRWDNRSIRRFMITFGIVSSVFDYLTFGVLLFLHVPASTFRTAWFLESVLSEILILLVIRTRRAFFRSPIGSALLWSSVGAAGVTLALPYTPLASLLGFVPLPLVLVAGVCGIVALYVLASEASKRLLFKEAHL